MAENKNWHSNGDIWVSKLPFIHDRYKIVCILPEESIFRAECTKECMEVTISNISKADLESIKNAIDECLKEGETKC